MHPNRQFPAHFVVHMPSCLHVLFRAVRPLHSNRGCDRTVAPNRLPYKAGGGGNHYLCILGLGCVVLVSVGLGTGLWEGGKWFARRGGGGGGRWSPLKEGGGVGKGTPVIDLLLNPYLGSLSTPFWPRDGRCYVAILPTCGPLRG